jgi:hypothetical protein
VKRLCFLAAAIVLGGCELMVPLDEVVGQTESTSQRGTGGQGGTSGATTDTSGGGEMPTTSSGTGGTAGDSVTDTTTSGAGGSSIDMTDDAGLIMAADGGGIEPMGSGGTKTLLDASAPMTGTGGQGGSMSRRDAGHDGSTTAVDSGGMYGCDLACGGTFCCTGQQCCPTACSIPRCILTAKCGNAAEIICPL